MSLIKRGNSSDSSKASMSADSLSLRMSKYRNILWTRWQSLTPRDQLALMLLTVFLLIFVGGYGGYSVHQAAKDSKTEYQQQVADYFWLRSQAGNIDSNAMNAASSQDGTSMQPAASVRALLNNSGIKDAQVAAVGEALQMSFSNTSQAVVSVALGKLEQQGWQFTQLSMVQDDVTKSVQVQATVTL